MTAMQNLPTVRADAFAPNYRVTEQGKAPEGVRYNTASIIAKAYHDEGLPFDIQHIYKHAEERVVENPRGFPDGTFYEFVYPAEGWQA